MNLKKIIPPICEQAYTIEQLEILIDLARGISENPERYIRSIYWQIKSRNIHIKNIFSYTLAVIQNELRKPINQVQELKTNDNPSYDFEKFLNDLYNQI